VHKQTGGVGAWVTSDIVIPLVPEHIDVTNNIQHTIVASGGGVVATSPEPYVEWTVIGYYDDSTTYVWND
jgi:hypothetical protein